MPNSTPLGALFNVLAAPLCNRAEHQTFCLSYFVPTVHASHFSFSLTFLICRTKSLAIVSCLSDVLTKRAPHLLQKFPFLSDSFPQFRTFFRLMISHIFIQMYISLMVSWTFHRLQLDFCVLTKSFFGKSFSCHQSISHHQVHKFRQIYNFKKSMLPMYTLTKPTIPHLIKYRENANYHDGDCHFCFHVPTFSFVISPKFLYLLGSFPWENNLFLSYNCFM